MTIEYTPDGTPYLSDQSYLSETPPYTQELAQIIDAGTGGGGVCDIKDSKFNDLQPADPISPFPIGMLAPFMGETAPDGWLLCDGRSYDAAYFYALAEANPDFHGDGVFRVPDLRGRSPIGTGMSHADYTRDFQLGKRFGDYVVGQHTHRVHIATAGSAYMTGWPGGGGSVTSLNKDQAEISNHATGAEDHRLIAGYQPNWYTAAPYDRAGLGDNYHPTTSVNFIVYTGKPTLDTNGDILPECGQGAEIAPVTTRQMIEARLAEADITEEEVKMLKEQLEEIKKTEAK